MISKTNKIATALLLTLAAAIASGWACAFNLTPIDVTLRPAGSGATQTFSVENPSPSAVAIEITMHQREMTEAGQDLLSPATDNFTVYPSQLILQPGARQSVRVQWNGASDLSQERAFRLIAEELPITLGADEDEGAGLDLLVRYVASVYVQPAGTEARLTIEPQATSEGLVLNVRNQGTMRAVLRDEDFQITADGQPVDLNDQQRESIAAVNVLAGHTRRIVVPGTAHLVDHEIEVQWLRDSD